jgi:hypothetical protein
MQALTPLIHRDSLLALICSVTQTSCGSHNSLHESEPDLGGQQNVATGGVAATTTSSTAARSGVSSAKSGGGVGGAMSSSITTTPGTLVNTGQVLIVQTRTKAFGLTVLPAFCANRSGEDCPSTTQGDCTFTPTCNSTVHDTYVSAGTITIASSSPLLDVVQKPDSDNAYVSQAIDVSFDAGVSLHVSAPGATVPAFSTDLAVPFALLIDSPQADPNGVIAVTTMSDLVIDYSGGTTEVDLVLDGISSAGSVHCDAVSTTGKLTIDARILAAIGSGSSLSLWTFGKSDIFADAWKIQVGFLTDVYMQDQKNPITVRVQ